MPRFSFLLIFALCVAVLTGRTTFAGQPDPGGDPPTAQPIAAPAAQPPVLADRPLPDRLWRASGKFHPLVVHFPIALLVVACVTEFMRRRKGSRTPGPTAFTCILLGALSAAVAATMGWAGAQTAGHQGSTADILFNHRWLGVAAAGVACITALIALAAKVRGTYRPFAFYRFALIVSAIMVSIAAHFGGALIYGEGYISEALAELRPSRAPRPGSRGPLVGASPSGPASLDNVDFARDILPIFAKRCYSCHAGDEVEGEFHLDSRETALRGGESGKPAIVPGSSATSPLVALISSADSLSRMPPKGKALTTDQIRLISAWIDQGAEWSMPGAAGAGDPHWHWSYRPVSHPTPPPTDTGISSTWTRNGIDSFVLDRLKQEGLAPSPEAPRETLIRRVSLDLIGLPPTIEEVDAFLADTRRDAYQRLVDRLLASPRYGERWARPWLDLARYADTHGYEKDDRRVMWPYRDWVIDALNRDQPYDRFTIDQLAGDLLPSPTLDQLIATGFHRNTMTNEEGGVDPEEFRVDAIVDRVNTTASVWLGTTLACAQCHDHKNDPISQKEYFSVYAIFNNAEIDTRPHATGSFAAGAMVPVPAKGRAKDLESADAEIARLERVLATQTPELDAAQAEWESRCKSDLDRWVLLRPTETKATSSATFTLQDDGSTLVGGESPASDTYTVTADTDLVGITAIRLEVIPDASQPGGGVGRSSHSNIVLANVAVAAAALTDPSVEPGAPVTLDAAVADFEQSTDFGGGGHWPITAAIDADPKTGWAIGAKAKEPHTAAFRFARPLLHAARLTITLDQPYGGQHTIGRFRLSATSGPWPPVATLPQDIATLIAIPTGDRTVEQHARLAGYYRATAPSLGPARERLAQLSKDRAGMIVASALVMRELAAPRETFVQHRGNFMDLGERVQPGVPAILPPLPEGEPPNRLTLARWLVDPKNPLTARVAVNRMWEQHFGRGLVGTSDDFGTQGDEPTHPELLDFLASEFVRGGWSMKSLHKLIVTSATYRQSSRITPELLELDPENHLLARGPRFRVEAEMVRDIALAASGLLSPKIGGPSVFPPQPDGVWTMIYNSDQWTPSTGEDRYRRGLYTFWRRTAPYPAFASFDAPSREIACTRRPRTNTPLQALTTLNDPAFIEAAAGLARRALASAPDTDSRIVFAFRTCVARRPTRSERERLIALYTQQLDLYTADPVAAKALIDSIPPPPEFAASNVPVSAAASPAEYAAWINVGNILLNLDETITKD